MMRVLTRSMMIRKGLYFFGEDLFSGIGFDNKNVGHVCGYVIDSGRIVGEYKPFILNGESVDRAVDITYERTEYERQLFGGALYSGAAYVFENDYCTTEILFSNGVVEASANWNLEGVLVAFSAAKAGFSESYAWYDDGNLRTVDISTGSSFAGHIEFESGGRIRYLKARNGFLRAIPTIRLSARFFPLESSGDLNRYSLAETLTLVGGEVDILFLRFLATLHDFCHVKHLVLIDCSLSADDLVGDELPLDLLTLKIEGAFEDCSRIEKKLGELRPGVQVQIRRKSSVR